MKSKTQAGTGLRMLIAGWLLIITCHGRTIETIYAIRLLTADSTLLEVIRSHNLVSILESKNEAEALSRLREMIDIIEDGQDNALEISVISDKPELAASLTGVLAKAAASMPAYTPLIETDKTVEELNADIRRQEDIVVEKRYKMMQIMKDLQIIDQTLNPAGPSSPEADLSPLPAEYERAKRGYEQQLAVLDFDRKATLKMRVKKPDAFNSLSKAEDSPIPLHNEPVRISTVKNITGAAAAGSGARPATASSAGKVKIIESWWIYPLLTLLFPLSVICLIRKGLNRRRRQQPHHR